MLKNIWLLVALIGLASAILYGNKAFSEPGDAERNWCFERGVDAQHIVMLMERGQPYDHIAAKVANSRDLSPDRKRNIMRMLADFAENGADPEWAKKHGKACEGI